MALTISGVNIKGSLSAVHIPPPPPPEYYLWSWGYNYYGRLGLGDTTNRSSPVQIGALTTWSSISGGSEHSMAVKTDGTMWTWGNGASGRLGLGNTTGYSSPKQIGALTTWSSIAAGGTWSMAIG